MGILDEIKKTLAKPVGHNYVTSAAQPIFNLHPAEAIKRLHHELETLEESSNASR